MFLFTLVITILNLFDISFLLQLRIKEERKTCLLPLIQRKKNNFYVGADIVLLSAALQYNPWENGQEACVPLLKS